MNVVGGESAAVIGRVLFIVSVLQVGGAAAGPVTAERVAALPVATRAGWQSYLDRSQAAAARDADALAAEVAAEKRGSATRAPSGGDFRFDDGDRSAAWFAGSDGAALVNAVISYQSPSGGWSKHLGYSQGPRRRGTQWTSQSEPGKKPHYLATIDNGATTKELRFLAAAWAATGRTDAAAAVNRGLDYLLEAQYPSGGWPQVYPLEGGYHDHVTLNDDAMTNVLELLRDVAGEAAEFACVTPDRRERVRRSLDQGIEYLLATQIPVAGRPSGWCAQYDPLTLEPAQGRAYEPPSLAGVESSHVLRFLMSLPNPSAEVVACIEAGLAWLNEAQVTGLARVKQDGRTLYVAQDSSTEVYWARFYDLTTGAPIYPGKDGVVYQSYVDLAAANHKLGYDYLSSRPGSILKNGQKKWRKRLATSR